MSDIVLPTDPKVIKEIIRQYHVKNGRKAGATNLKKGGVEYFKRINKLAVVARWGEHVKPTDEENKCLLKANKMNSDSKKFGTGETITAEELKQIMEENNHQCANCSTKELLGFSRIISYKNNGKNVISNYMILCRSCNSKRMHNKSI